MEDEEILKKAIEKAKKSGYKFEYGEMVIDNSIEEELYYSIIFTHSFAKAFWKIERVILNPNKKGEAIRFGYKEIRDIWKHHLQQMVLEEQPLLYLEKFL